VPPYSNPQLAKRAGVYTFCFFISTASPAKNEKRQNLLFFILITAVFAIIISLTLSFLRKYAIFPPDFKAFEVF
jgi:hypothetical protein